MDDPYKTLAFEVYKLAADDYLRYRKMELTDKSISAEGKANYFSAKKFLASPYFEWMSGVNSQRMLHMLENECQEWKEKGKHDKSNSRKHKRRS